MQVHPSLHFIAQRPRAFYLLAVKVEFGRIGDAQHHRGLLHPRCRALPMRLHHVCPLDFLIAQKSIGTNGLSPAIAGARNARRWPGSKPLEQFLRPSVPPRITQIERLKFLVHPCSRLNAHSRSKIRE